MKVKCKIEAINKNGNKMLEFTKGKIYDCESNDDEFIVIDDFGHRERFWSIEKMFEIID